MMAESYSLTLLKLRNKQMYNHIVNQNILSFKSTVSEEIKRHMAANGADYDQEIIFDGEIYRYSRDQKKNQRDEWLVAFEGISSKNNPFAVVTYGSWSDGSKFTFKSWDNRIQYLDEKEKQELHLALNERQKKVERMILERQNQAAEEAKRIWERSAEASPNEEYAVYANLKKISPCFARFGKNPNGFPSIILPLFNIEGEMRSLQFISVGESNKVYKTFLLDGEKKGNFMTLGELRDGVSIQVAEGYATGSDCYLATEAPTVIAFDCGNLMPVINLLRERYPHSEIVICGDDDFQSENNPGYTAAIQAAIEHGCKVVFPKFPEELQEIRKQKSLSDFNDLKEVCGIAEVKSQIQHAQTPLELLLGQVASSPLDTDPRKKIYLIAYKALSKENPIEKDCILKKLGDALKSSGVKDSTIKREFKQFCKEYDGQGRSLDMSRICEAEQKIIEALTEIFDPPILLDHLGEVQGINQMFFSNKFAHERIILHEPSERTFYEYQPDTGLWVYKTHERVKIDLGHSFLRLIKLFGYEELLTYRTDFMLNQLLGLLKGSVEQQDVFQRKRGIIHVGNGILRLNEDPDILHEFSPDYYSRNRSEIILDPKAECPRFLNELIYPAMASEDANLLQKYCGQCLLGYNPSQTILLISGTAGGGKSTLANVIEIIIGLHNVAQLKMNHLSERFEVASFVGKTLLTGKDVPGDFLNNRKGASVLKALVGGDRLSAEQKNLKRRFEVIGEFNIIVTSNTRLHVRLDSDTGAWKRRLLIIEFEKAAPKKPIPNFADLLVTEEGSGILNWMIEGAVALLEELKEYGRVQLSGEQGKRVDDLLSESDSIRAFAQQCIERRSGSDVTVAELVEAYSIFCDDRGWQALPVTAFENQIRNIMLEIHQINRRHDIRRESNQRGFMHVAILRDQLKRET